MTSVTAVPIPPVKKSVLATLWIGIAALLIAAGAYAWWTSKAPEIKFTVVKEGAGPSPTDADVVLIKYRGTLDDGTEFDANEQAPMPVAGSVPGFSEALKRMKKGGEYKIVIPPALGYGKKGNGPVPANSNLNFEVTLIDFKSQAEIQAMQQMMMQQQMQQQGGQGQQGQGPQELPPGMIPQGQ